jgi:hypothetical protein
VKPTVAFDVVAEDDFGCPNIAAQPGLDAFAQKLSAEFGIACRYGCERFLQRNA